MNYCRKKLVHCLLLITLCVIGTDVIANPTFGKMENCNFLIFTSENSVTMTSLQEAILESNKTKKWLPDMHWSYGAYGGAIVYSYIFTKMLTIAYTIRHTNFWTFWNKETPIALITEKELWYAVEKKYNSTELKHHIMVYQEAMNAIDCEEQYLIALTTLHKRLYTLRLHWLFPRQTVIMKEVAEGLQRLMVLRLLLTSYVLTIAPKIK